MGVEVSAPMSNVIQMILDNLKTADVQQTHKDDRITFVSESGADGQASVAGESQHLQRSFRVQSSESGA